MTVSDFSTTNDKFIKNTVTRQKGFYPMIDQLQQTKDNLIIRMEIRKIQTLIVVSINLKK